MHYLVDGSLIDNHSGLALSLTCSTVLAVMRVLTATEPLVFPFLAMIFSGVVFPVIYWELSLDSFPVWFGVLSILTSALFFRAFNVFQR